MGWRYLVSAMPGNSSVGSWGQGLLLDYTSYCNITKASNPLGRVSPRTRPRTKARSLFHIPARNHLRIGGIERLFKQVFNLTVGKHFGYFPPEESKLEQEDGKW